MESVQSFYTTVRVPIGVFSLHKYKGSKGIGIRNVWKWKIILKYKENRKMDIHKEKAMFIQLTRLVIALVVILAQRETQGWDNIGFTVVSVAIQSIWGLTQVFAFLVTSFTAIILCAIISIRPCL
jgi:hypothetical protein